MPRDKGKKKLPTREGWEFALSVSVLVYRGQLKFVALCVNLFLQAFASLAIAQQVRAHLARIQNDSLLLGWRCVLFGW